MATKAKPTTTTTIMRRQPSNTWRWLLIHLLVAIVVISTTTTTTARVSAFRNDEEFEERMLGYSRYYNDGTMGGSLTFSVCEQSVVYVTYMSVLCNSPYTFYYGNGANRNSPHCDYRDQASLFVKFRVVDDLQDGDNIYVTMAVYDNSKNLLVSTDPSYLCKNYVGYECTEAGVYSFSTTLRLMAPYQGNQTKFTPYVQLAFSTRSDSGTNLGAVNTVCRYWDQNDVTILAIDQAPNRTPAMAFLESYGILLFACSGLILCGLFVWRHAKPRYRNEIEYVGQHHESALSPLPPGPSPSQALSPASSLPLSPPPPPPTSPTSPTQIRSPISSMSSSLHHKNSLEAMSDHADFLYAEMR